MQVLVHIADSHTSDINQLNVFLSKGLEDYERPDSALLRASSLKQELRKLVAVLYVLFIHVRRGCIIIVQT